MYLNVLVVVVLVVGCLPRVAGRRIGARRKLCKTHCVRARGFEVIVGRRVVVGVHYAFQGNGGHVAPTRVLVNVTSLIGRGVQLTTTEPTIDDLPEVHRITFISRVLKRKITSHPDGAVALSNLRAREDKDAVL